MARARARKAADLTGAFVNPGPAYLQSSGAIGRLVPDDVAGLGRYVREHTPASA